MVNLFCCSRRYQSLRSFNRPANGCNASGIGEGDPALADAAMADAAPAGAALTDAALTDAALTDAALADPGPYTCFHIGRSS